MEVTSHSLTHLHTSSLNLLLANSLTHSIKSKPNGMEREPNIRVMAGQAIPITSFLLLT